MLKQNSYVHIVRIVPKTAFSLLCLFWLVSLSASSQIIWSQPIVIDSSGPGPMIQVLSRLAIDDRGTVFVAWSQAGNYIMLANTTGAGAHWTRNVAVSGPGLARYVRDLLIDQRGNIWLLWSYLESEFSAEYLNLWKSSDGGVSFAPQFTAQEYGGPYFFSQIATDQANNIYLLWDDSRFTLTRFARGDSLQRTDTKIPHDSLAIGMFYDVLTGPVGTVYCLWEGRRENPDNSSDSYVLCSVSLDSGKSFAAARRIDSSLQIPPVGSFQRYPQGAVDKQGNLNVVYTRGYDVNTWDVRFSKSVNHGDSFLPGTNIYHLGTNTDPRVCIDSLSGINILWTATDGLRYSRSTDGGVSFSASALIGAGGRSSVSADNQGALHACIDAGLVFYLSTTGTAAVDASTHGPITSAELQNYPNPFNTSTSIRYSLPRKSAVQLTVFNTLGQQVTTLTQGEKGPGYHDVRFDASGLSSGVYLYRLTAGSYVQTRKFVLIR